MKKLLIILLLPICVNAQSISAGYSFDFWGATKQTAEVSAFYKDFGVHYFHNFSSDKHISGRKWAINNRTSTFAVSYRPIKYRFINIGGIVSPNKFPTNHATHANFYLRLDLPVKFLTISYTHISNGFGLFHHTNTGYDSLTIRFNI